MNITADTERRSLNVAIVGGGVVGLTCAVALLRADVHVELFEAAARFEEIGAGVGIGANAARILASLGVLDEVLVKTQEPGLTMGSFSMKSGMDEHQLIYEYPWVAEDDGVGAHRASFLDALIAFIDPKFTHFHKRCVSVLTSTTESPRQVIHFADGTTHEADVVIGGDGIKSSVRTAVTGSSETRVAFSNTICYRGLIPYEAVKAAGVKTDFGRPIMFLGKGKHLVVFPVRNQALINVVAFAADHTIPIGSVQLPPDQPRVILVPQEEMLKEYEGWGNDVIGLLSCIPKPSKWFIHVVHPPLESYVKGRIALVGDAAHGMLPHLGAGAGQGIEDAYVIAGLLSNPQTSPSNVESVLQAYDRIRRPRAQMVWEASYRAGRVYDGFGDHGLSPEGVEQDIGRQWDPVYKHDIDNDIEQAVAWLKEMFIFA
ncbi:hypothetical protein POSPLADRAFT_1072093 [Postia placenta MAD-698-R-SB12]|uniref:FAD-binding domain-containing protein n=1 Tax=Postia placenta MAD-698-R-SB12 TaxID=670580 RepID=A0A1X6NE52_9APHY|nr:hypothetical protein POSPLADRAFT_1072093 [Postia placenta MAD-698-R-SB12]OSX66927.1 hypothetical protein POSPLADRAFT_1072093 [Postia placenta MAD-698-R-SB12]